MQNKPKTKQDFEKELKKLGIRPWEDEAVATAELSNNFNEKT